MLTVFLGPKVIPFSRAYCILRDREESVIKALILFHSNNLGTFIHISCAFAFASMV